MNLLFGAGVVPSISDSLGFCRHGDKFIFWVFGHIIFHRFRAVLDDSPGINFVYLGCRKKVSSAFWIPYESSVLKVEAV